ncbi:MAG: hypothetical protein Q9191_006313 [Dirinaria sp. TL-2023a]
MTEFYTEDIVAFKSDPFIVGTVEYTWRDVDELPEDINTCYWHRDTPEIVKEELTINLQVPRGYVIISFQSSDEFLCIVHEKSLTLVDRALAVGDVVKRRLPDPQSGTVTSTSLKCAVRPVTSAAKYATKDFPAAHGICPDYYLPKWVHHQCPGKCLEQPHPAFLKDNEQLDNVPASELRYFKRYYENDHIIYQDWIGQVQFVTDEVTLRLSNGSVVTVQDPEELNEYLWLEGSYSSELHRRLFQNDFVLNWSKQSLAEDVKAKERSAQPCFPGQVVQTKKGNLRRGLWKFGAYDPNVLPRGTVVDVRTVQLEVAWILPNMFKPRRGQGQSPRSLLDLDTLESDEITIYDRSRKPRQTEFHCLSPASYSPDIGYGFHVRFRDVMGAALKYDGSRSDETGSFRGCFHRIPRTATQGFDMNVFEVTETRTRVTVQWQDGSLTEEDSTFLVPYNNVDDQDVWPGEIVSLKAEEQSSEGSWLLTCRKLGIIQSVNALERIAKVRWFQNAVATMPDSNKDIVTPPTRFGLISNEYSFVSLYDIAAYPAHRRTLGDLIIVVPNPLPAAELVQSDQPLTVQFLLQDIYKSFGERPPTLFHPSISVDIPSADDEYMSEVDQGIDWFGEVIRVNLDGTIVVRLGAAPEVRDIELPIERCIMIGNEDESSEEDDEEDEDSVESLESDDVSDSNKSDVTIDMEIEYEGGSRIDDDPNDEMWTTEDDEEIRNSIEFPGYGKQGCESHNVSREEAEKPESETAAVSHQVLSQLLRTALQLSRYPKMPAQFQSLLGESVPLDHHFINFPSSLPATKIRRIVKEHSILSDSLPEGVFARSWDSRIDLLRVLIIGPVDTPYELCPFVFDFRFGSEFPDNPPQGYFHSWTDGRGRINPNLYEDGKICLSLLGTWPGDDENESWNKNGSTMLQVIVSLLGLVLVREPYFNEAGFEVLANTDESRTTSALYTERAFVLARGFLQHALKSKPGGVDDIIRWLYDCRPGARGPRLLSTVIEQAKARMVGEMHDIDDSGTDKGSEVKEAHHTKLSRGASIMLERTITWLENYACQDSSSSTSQPLSTGDEKYE